MTHKEGFVIGIQFCQDNPYDGHTLDGQFDQVERFTDLLPPLLRLIIVRVRAK